MVQKFLRELNNKINNETEGLVHKVDLAETVINIDEKFNETMKGVQEKLGDLTRN